MELTYNWDNYPLVIDYLRKLYTNTLLYMQENDYDIKYAQEFIIDVEDLLYYFKLKKYSVNIILNKIKYIEVIEFYDSLFAYDKFNNDDILMPGMNRGIKILLSTSINGDKRLSSKERRRLYLYQGFAKSIFSFNNKKTIAFSKFFSRYLDNNKSITEATINNGWLLLENTLAQELAEKATYNTLNKIRPGYHLGLDNEIYPISDYKINSNLEMYRMFQEILIHFGLTISKIGSLFNYSEKSILNDLIHLSIDNNFSDIVINEYSQKNKLLELYQLLYLMGLLLNEKYRQYHINFIKTELSFMEVDMIYDNIMKLIDSLINFDSKEIKDSELSKVISLYDDNVKLKIKKLINEHEI